MVMGDVEREGCLLATGGVDLSQREGRLMQARVLEEVAGGIECVCGGFVFFLCVVCACQLVHVQVVWASNRERNRRFVMSREGLPSFLETDLR